MPLYTYTCSKAHEAEELRSVEERREPLACPTCGDNMELVIGTPGFDTLHMGVDSGFPTFYKKWGRIQEQKNRGKIRDENNTQIKGDYF